MLIFAFALASVAVAAWLRGGRAERQAAAMYVAAAVATALVRSRSPDRYLHLQVGVMVVDAALLLGLCLIVLREDRWWPIASAALQLVTMLGHVAKIIDPTIGRMAYFSTVVGSSVPSLILLIIGIANHARRDGRKQRSGCSNTMVRETLKMP